MNVEMKVKSGLDRIHARAVDNRWLRLFTAVTRVLLAVAFVPSGLVKAQGHRFTAVTATPVGSFFEAFFQAEGYYRFVGIAQLLAAGLLLFRRTAALGAVIYFPIILNIFVITVSVGFGLTGVIAGLMALANIYLLCWEYDRWKALLPGFSPRSTDVLSRHVAGRVLAALVASLVLGMAGVMRAHRAWLHDRPMHTAVLLLAAGAAVGLGALWLHLRAESRATRRARSG